MRLSIRSLMIGLGTGIVLTAAFFMFLNFQIKAFKPNGSLTDEQIIEKSRELGMVNPLDIEPEKFILSDEEIVNRAKKLGMEFSSQVNLETYKKQEDKVDLDYDTIFIPKGMKSKEISMILYKNNLVDDSEQFDLYLQSNGVDQMLNDGYFNIPKNSDYDTLVNILTK